MNLLPRLLWSNTAASGYTLTLQAQSGAAMEHSLHRVSLCSRRAQPGLSFYLTTFGKCPLRPAARATAPRSQRPERIDEVGSRQAFCLGEPSLAPSSCGCPGGAQAMQAAGHHLLLGHWCQVRLALSHWAGIIMPQLIFQRPGLSPLSFPLASSLGQSRSCSHVSTSPFSFLWCRDRAGARSAQVGLIPGGLTLEAV